MPIQTTKPGEIVVDEDGITHRTKFPRDKGIGLSQFQYDKGFLTPQDAIRFLIGNALDNLGYPKTVHIVTGNKK